MLVLPDGELCLKANQSQVSICIVPYYVHISTVLRWPMLARGSHIFTCHPHTNHTYFYSPGAEHHRPLAGTYCTYPRQCGQDELMWVAGYGVHMVLCCVVSGLHCCV